MSIVVHHLNTSRSERIPWILEELGADYEVKVHFRGPTRAAPASLAKVSPLGKAPAVTINGTTLIESGPIVHTLIAQHSSPNVETTPSQSSIFWSHFSEGSLMNPMDTGIVLSIGERMVSKKLSPEEGKGAKALRDWHRAFVTHRVNASLAYVEEFLSHNDNFSGTDKIGEGDIMMGWILLMICPEKGARAYKVGPATEAWVKRTRARPGYQRAMARLAKEERAQAAKL